VSTTTATVQYIITKILQKYSNFCFYNTVYSAHKENKIQYPDIDMCIGEPLVQGFSTFFPLSTPESQNNQPEPQYAVCGVALHAHTRTG